MPFVSPSIEDFSLSYDTGLAFAVKTVNSINKEALYGENYEAKSKLLVVSNLGAGHFKDEIITSITLENGESFSNPGLWFQVEREGNIIRVVSPCCGRVLTSFTTFQQKKKYAGCPTCKKALLPAPLHIAAFIEQKTRLPREAVTLETFTREYATIFSDVYEAIVMAYDLTEAFTKIGEVSKTHYRELDTFDRTLKKQKRLAVKHSRFDKKFDKYLSAVRKKLEEQDLYSQEIENILKDRSKLLM